MYIKLCMSAFNNRFCTIQTVPNMYQLLPDPQHCHSAMCLVISDLIIILSCIIFSFLFCSRSSRAVLQVDIKSHLFWFLVVASAYHDQTSSSNSSALDIPARQSSLPILHEFLVSLPQAKFNTKQKLMYQSNLLWGRGYAIVYGISQNITSLPWPCFLPPPPLTHTHHVCEMCVDFQCNWRFLGNHVELQGATHLSVLLWETWN